SKIEPKALAGIVARLNRFVEGARVSVSTPTIGDGKGEIKALRTKDKVFFALRFFDVSPQRRIIGVFIKKDIFLGCHIYNRDKLDFEAACAKARAFLKTMGADRPNCLTYEPVDNLLSNWVES